MDEATYLTCQVLATDNEGVAIILDCNDGGQLFNRVLLMATATPQPYTVALPYYSSVPEHDNSGFFVLIGVLLILFGVMLSVSRRDP